MRRRADVAVPARAPIAEYLPTLTQLCGQETDALFPAAWSLALPGARPLPPSMSLFEAQVVDGATLYLRDVVEGETDEPYVTDLEELVKEVGDGWDRWNSRHRAFTVIAAGLGAMVAALAVLVLGSPGAPLPGIVCVVAGFGLAALGGTARRRGWPIPVPLRLAVALAVCPLLALAGYALPVARHGTGPAAIAVVVGAVVGALAAVLAVPDVCTLVVGLFAVLALPVTILFGTVRANLVECAAVIGVVGLIVLSAAPAAAGRLVVLAPSGRSPGRPSSPEADIAAAMSRGRAALMALAVVSSLVCAGCLLVLGDSRDPYAVGLALCLSLALLTQPGRSNVPVAVMSTFAAGAVGLLALAIRAPVQLLHAPVAAPALITCVLGAVALGVGFGMAMQPAQTPEERPAWLSAAGFLLPVLSIPLAVGVFGVFQHLAQFGGRF